MTISYCHTFNFFSLYTYKKMATTLQMLSELLMFIAITFIVYTFITPKRNDTTSKRAMCLFWMIIAWLLYMYLFSVEGFRFEVTPWKKTCLNDRGHRCPQCCRPGFNGLPVSFRFEGDRERMEAAQQGNCPYVDPNVKQQVSNYSTLSQTYQLTDPSVENYVLGCHDKYRGMSDFAPYNTEPQGLKVKATGTQPTLEPYCNYRSMNDFAPYNTEPQGLKPRARGTQPTLEPYLHGDDIDPYSTEGGDCGCGV